MKIVKQDIWRCLSEGYCVIVPTNGHVNQDGNAVMGKGIAYQANKLFKGLSKSLGSLIKSNGHSVFYYPRQRLITFPTKHHWKQPADLKLIENSCQKLKALMIQNQDIRVVMPKVGCGNGKLSWDSVAPILQSYFNEFPESRFMIVDNESGDCGQDYRGDNIWSEKGKSVDTQSSPKII